MGMNAVALGTAVGVAAVAATVFAWVKGWLAGLGRWRRRIVSRKTSFDQFAIGTGWTMPGTTTNTIGSDRGWHRVRPIWLTVAEDES